VASHIVSRHNKFVGLYALVDYFRDTWLRSRLWPASSWTSFQSSVRTNNDVEGRHNTDRQGTASWTCTSWRLSYTKKRSKWRCRRCSSVKTGCVDIRSQSTSTSRTACRTSGRSTQLGAIERLENVAVSLYYNSMCPLFVRSFVPPVRMFVRVSIGMFC